MNTVTIDTFDVRGGGPTTNTALHSARENAARLTRGDGFGWAEDSFTFQAHEDYEDESGEYLYVICTLRLARIAEGDA